jgi:hypothetical protein
MEFCERPLCGVFTQPSNTWSNVGYVIAGLLVLRLARRERQMHLAPIGWSALAVAVGSAFFHASSTFVGEVVDIGAMFLFATFWLAFDLHRFLGWSIRAQRLFMAIATAASVILLILQRNAGIGIFTLQITATFVLEFVLGVRRLRKIRAGLNPRRVNFRPLRNLSVVFAFAYTSWRLDVHRIVCDRDLHWISGHAMWHLLNSFCFYFLYRFLGQFPAEAGEETAAQRKLA